LTYCRSFLLLVPARSGSPFSAFCPFKTGDPPLSLTDFVLPFCGFFPPPQCRMSAQAIRPPILMRRITQPPRQYTATGRKPTCPGTYTSAITRQKHRGRSVLPPPLRKGPGDHLPRYPYPLFPSPVLCWGCSERTSLPQFSQGLYDCPL